MCGVQEHAFYLYLSKIPIIYVYIFNCSTKILIVNFPESNKSIAINRSKTWRCHRVTQLIKSSIYHIILRKRKWLAIFGACFTKISLCPLHFMAVVYLSIDYTTDAHRILCFLHRNLPLVTTYYTSYV